MPSAAGQPGHSASDVAARAAHAARSAWAAAQPSTGAWRHDRTDDDGFGDGFDADPADDQEHDTAAPAALTRLIARLQRRPDFVALQAQVRRLQIVARDERAHVRKLAALLADNPALAAKVLRLTNAAYYRSVGGGQIACLARAVQVMGFDTVQQLATGLRLLDPLPCRDAGLLLREDFLRALVAGRLAAELCPVAGEQEQAHVLAMFQNLGRMLLAAHLGEDALAIRAAVPRDTPGLAAAEQAACRRLLGVDFGRIGMHVARSWGWPPALVHAMCRRDWPRRRPAQRAEQRVWQGWLANELADLLLYTDPATWPEACEPLSQRSFGACGHGAPALRRALARVRQHLDELAASVGLPLDLLASIGGVRTAHGAAIDERRPGDAGLLTPGRRLRIGAGGATVDIDLTEPAPPIDESASDAAAAAPAQAAPADAAADLRPLAAAAARLSADLLCPRGRPQVPRRALAALQQGLRARRAVLCLPDEARRATGHTLTGETPERLPQRQVLLSPRLVLGEPLSPAALALWRVAPGRGRDLFSRLCTQASDSCIDDGRHPGLALHLPADFRQHVGAEHFLVLPVQAGSRSLGMIYLDRAPGDPFTLDGDALQLVRALRNQVALALDGAAPALTCP